MQELTEEEVVEDYYGLVVHLCKPYMRNYERDDLVNEGLIAVLIAFRKYDPSAGAALTTYVSQEIKFAIGKFARKSKSGFHIPHETERVRRLLVKNKLIDMPAEEISKATGISLQNIQYALLAYQRGTAISADVEVSLTGEAPQSIANLVEHHDDLTHLDVELFLEELTERERFILGRLSDDMSQPEIAKELNTYQMKISRELKVIRDKYTKWERIS